MEVYATAISMNSIFFKCPFNVKQGMHVIANDNHNLRSRIEHNTIVECDAGCEHVVNVHIIELRGLESKRWRNKEVDEGNSSKASSAT